VPTTRSIDVAIAVVLFRDAAGSLPVRWPLGWCSPWPVGGPLIGTEPAVPFV